MFHISLFRHLALISAAIFLTDSACAQKKINQQELNEKIKRAQSMLDSVKRSNPALKNISMPDISQKGKAATSNLNAGTAQLHQMQSAQNKKINNYLPEKNSTAGATVIEAPEQTALKLLANAKLQVILPKIDPAMRGQLDKVINDTTVDAAGIAILLMANGVPKWTGEYMVCKHVLSHPDNQWSVNDLGVVFRNEKQYKEAIQCFRYAEKLNDSSIVYKTNLGWAYSYYGDFNSAMDYFNKALSIDKNFSSALEGLAVIDFKEGNIQALFQCLAREVTGFGGGGSGPSGMFTSLCGGVQTQQQIDNMGKQDNSDPNDDHTYDQGGEDEDSQQDPPPTADVEPVQYPSLKRLFINDSKDLEEIAKQYTDYQKKILAEISKEATVLAQKRSGLPKLSPDSYIDEYGDKITPYSYEKFYNLFHNIHLIFDKRIDWWMEKLNDEMNNYLKGIPPKDQDMLINYGKALDACKNNEGCENKVKCEWIPRFHNEKNNDLEGVVRIWNKYFDHIMENTVWYCNATAPFIKRVHQPKWNEYMNLEREWDVRKAILRSYATWASSLLGIQGGAGGGMVVLINHVTLDCKIETPELGGSADPYSKKHGKLKTFAGPCYTQPTSIDAVFIEYENNCDRTKVTVKSGPFKGYIEKNYSKKFKEDDYWQTGVSVGISKTVGYEQKSGDWKGSVEGKVSAEIGIFSRFDSDLYQTEHGYDVDLSAEASGGVKTGNAVVDKVNTIHFEKGVDIHIEVVAGQDGVSRTTVSGSKK